MFSDPVFFLFSQRIVAAVKITQYSFSVFKLIISVFGPEIFKLQYVRIQHGNIVIMSSLLGSGSEDINSGNRAEQEQDEISRDINNITRIIYRRLNKWVSSKFNEG